VKDAGLGEANSWLEGKVKCWSLPVVTPPADPAMLKRVVLPQGELTQFHNGSLGIHYIAAIDFVPGTTRGNHYHRTKREFVYLLRGSVSVCVRDLASGVNAVFEMKQGDLAWIETDVAHAFSTVEAGLGVEFSPVPFDPLDVHKLQLV
jgi:hypothetical protein